MSPFYNFNVSITFILKITVDSSSLFHKHYDRSVDILFIPLVASL